MSLINHTKLRHTLPWVDAFTMQLESIAEAKNHPEMRREVDEAVKRAEREALRTGSEQAVHVAANQRMIQRAMAFNAEDHKELMRLWKEASQTLLSLDWDLSTETHYQVESEGGPLRFWQGDDPKSKAKATVVPRPIAALVIKFLRFVEANSTQFDPRVHVQRTLAKQGITKENFHLHADKLAITNPWLTE